eukprot:1134246-Pelagomonas_calceolata.AAC.3
MDLDMGGGYCSCVTHCSRYAVVGKTQGKPVRSKPCEGSFAFGPAILSLAGFFMGVLWIDTLASEVRLLLACQTVVFCLGVQADADSRGRVHARNDGEGHVTLPLLDMGGDEQRCQAKRGQLHKHPHWVGGGSANQYMCRIGCDEQKVGLARSSILTLFSSLGRSSAYVLPALPRRSKLKAEKGPRSFCLPSPTTSLPAVYFSSIRNRHEWRRFCSDTFEPVLCQIGLTLFAGPFCNETSYFVVTKTQQAWHTGSHTSLITIHLQVVGIVSLTSRLLGLPPSLVGLTLLAVGSSLGDFFGNPSMARVGACWDVGACWVGSSGWLHPMAWVVRAGVGVLGSFTLEWVSCVDAYWGGCSGWVHVQVGVLGGCILVFWVGACWVDNDGAHLVPTGAMMVMMMTMSMMKMMIVV